MKDFEGRVAVVTGAASGIGLALCWRFAELGMRVVLADIEAESLKRAEGELSARGHEVSSVVTDVARMDSLVELAQQSHEAFGPVHVLCNNAGVFTGGLTWEAPLSDFQWVLDVNVWGVIHGVRAFLPGMLEHGEPAHVVNTASMAALTSAPFSSAYFMSKHAVLAYSESLYHELARRAPQIGVSALCPELVATRIGESERNRPAHLARKAGEDGSDEAQLVEQALRTMAPTGAAPERIAERVVDAIREHRFYVLPDPGSSWIAACESRMEDIRQRRNPRLAAPEEGV